MNRYEHHTDPDLVNLLIDSDQLAFESIYRRYAAELNRFVFRKTGSREDGEEIVQEIFVWLWTHRHNLKRVTQLKTYLYQAAKNRVLNYFRSEKVRTEYAADFSRYEAGDKNTTQEQMDLEDLTTAVEESLATLPDRCQTAFRLSRIDHMPISRIAEHMALSHRTVENYISQALKHLRKTLPNAP